AGMRDLEFLQRISSRCAAPHGWDGLLDGRIATAGWRCLWGAVDDVARDDRLDGIKAVRPNDYRLRRNLRVSNCTVGADDLLERGGTGSQWKCKSARQSRRLYGQFHSKVPCFE